MGLPGGASCVGCIFWALQADLHTRDGKRMGQCRESSPVCIEHNGRPATRWPLTREDEWCGSHAVPVEPEEVEG